MKRYFFLTLAALCILPGCGRRANEGVVEGPGGEKLIVHPLDKIKLAQGETKKFSVAVQRVKLDGPIQLIFGKLPQGTHLEPKDTTVAADKNEIILTLKVDGDAPPIKETPIPITAHLDKNQVTSRLLLEITESLDHKATQKDAFVKDMQTRLDALKKQLDAQQAKIKDLNADAKASFLKQISKLTMRYADVRKSYDSMVATPLEQWERMRNEVGNAVASLEKAVTSFQNSLNKAVMK